MGPPSKSLTSRGVVVTVVEALDDGSGGRATFATVDDLVGEAPDRFAVKLPGDTLAIEEGRRYVLAHTAWKLAARFPASPRPSPEGIEVVAVPGIGPGLFRNKAAVRTLATANVEPKPSQPKLRRTLRRLLRSDDPVDQRLAALELLTRLDLRDALRRSDVRAIRRAAVRSASDAIARDLLLNLALVTPGARGPWMGAAARDVLAAVPSPVMDLESPWPSLVDTSFRVLREQGEPADAPLAAKFLPSNNLRVAESALEVLGEVAPEQAAAQVDAALARPDLLPGARRSFEQWRRQNAPSATAQPAASDPSGR
jgi:hypothetical protein